MTFDLPPRKAKDGAQGASLAIRKEEMGSFSVFCDTQLLCQKELVRVATIRK